MVPDEPKRIMHDPVGDKLEEIVREFARIARRPVPDAVRIRRLNAMMKQKLSELPKLN